MRLEFANNQKSHVFIEGIVEVVLCQALWKRIVTLKKKYHRLTFSWITRYCIFMLINDKNFYKSKKYILLKNELEKKKQDTSETKKADRHRHKVCLYGDDEIYLKYLSIQLRIPMSLIIRIALLTYLPELEKNFGDTKSQEAESMDLFYELFKKIKTSGTKVIKTIEFAWKKIKHEYKDKLEFQFLLFYPEDIF